MKIGIITFNSAHNYGAVLQAWSLQTYLQKLGHEVDIVNLRLSAIDNVYVMAVKKKYVDNRYLNAAINQARIVKRCVGDPKKYKRYRAFENFINHKLHVTKVYRNSEELKADESLVYDVLIAGSDQIWNSSLTKKVIGAYFLDFAGKEVKRISYAASIGRKELPKEEIDLIREYLRNFDYISVREINAWKAVQPLTEKEVKIVADPTFLLEKKDFDGLRKPYPVKEPYIYVHNVHLAKEDARLNSVAEELSLRTGLPIVSNRKEQYFSKEIKNRKFLTGTPEEFIGVISEAEYVVTNSFHATVFALIYHRNFITIPHITNPDRMQNLLRELGVENHLMASVKMLPEDLSELDIDYDSVEKKKKSMREESVEFLNKALNGPKIEETKVTFHGVPVMEKKNPDIVPKRALVSAKNTLEFRDDILCSNLAPLIQEVIKSGGKYVLPVYDENMKIVYKVTDDIGMLSKATLPELFEAEFENIHEEVKRLLAEGKRILFIGNACRLKALESYLGDRDEKLIMVETVCHGCADSKIHDAYMKHLEDVYKSKLVQIELYNTFREPGQFYTIYNFASGAVKVELTSKETLCVALKRNYIQKLPCYLCGIRGGKSGCADYTIGLVDEYKELSQKEVEKFSTAHKAAVLSVLTPRAEQMWKTIEGQYETCMLEANAVSINDIIINSKRLEGMKMIENKKDVYQVLTELRAPKKKR